MSGPTPPRRPSSRTPTPRPRRVAGQGRPAAPLDPTELDGPDAPDAGRPVDLTKPEAPVEASPEAEPSTEVTVRAPRRSAGPVPPPSPRPGPPRPDLVADGAQPPSRRRRVVLVAVAAVLVVLAAVEGVYLLRHDDAPAPTAGQSSGQPSGRPSGQSSGTPSDAPTGVPAPGAAHPVQVPQDQWLAVVAQSATAATTILSAAATTPEAYDQEVDASTALMTDPFAEQFRQTKADVKDDFLAARTKVTVDISWQGVVTATPQEITTLLFLTQSTTKGGTGLTAVQFRVTVTMLHTDDGWLVGDLQAS